MRANSWRKRSACCAPWYPLLAASALGIPVGAPMAPSTARAAVTTLFPADTPSLYPRAAVVTALLMVSRLAIYINYCFFKSPPRSPSSPPAPRRQVPQLRSRPPLQKFLRRPALWCPNFGIWCFRIRRLLNPSTCFRFVDCARGRRRQSGSELVSKTHRSCFRQRLRNSPSLIIGGDFPAATLGGDISKARQNCTFLPSRESDP